MAQCLVCGNMLSRHWRFCMKCGARIEEDTEQKVRSINYLLQELAKWRLRGLIDVQTQEILFNEYTTLRDDLIAGLKPVAHSVKQLDAIQKPQTAVINAGSESQEPKMKPELESRPTAYKSFSELVIEHISAVFALAASLLAAGVLLYYRHEVYVGLKNPYVQALVLGIVTLGSLVSGWTLARRNENTSGRALTIVGSLLLPINPWFLVKIGVLEDRGNAWVLGSVCTALYLWTAYFLRSRLYVYFGLVAGYLTAISLALKIAQGVSPVAAALMFASLACFAAYSLLSRNEKTCYYSAPFFSTAHIGVALCLLFYTPAIKYLPQELTFAKRYFDPSSYNTFIACWLSLCAIGGYLYSAFARSRGRYVYLAYAALFWAEALLLAEYKAVGRLWVLVVTATVFFTRYVSDRVAYDTYVKLAVERAGWLSCSVLSIYVCYIHLQLLEGSLPGWTAVATLFVLGGYYLYLVLRKQSEPAHYFFWWVASAAIPLTVVNLGTGLATLPALSVLTAGVYLYLSREGKLFQLNRLSFRITFYGLSLLALMYFLARMDKLSSSSAATIALMFALLMIVQGLNALSYEARKEAIGVFFVSATSLTFSFAFFIEYLDSQIQILDDPLRLLLLSLWILVLRLATGFEKVPIELRRGYDLFGDVFSAFLTLGPLFSLAELLFGETKPQVVVVLAAVALAVRSWLCILVQSSRYVFRNVLNALLLSVIGVSLLGELSCLIGIRSKEFVTAEYVLLSFGYILLSRALLRRGYPRELFTFEAFAYLVSALTLLFTFVNTIVTVVGVEEAPALKLLLTPVLATVVHFYVSRGAKGEGFLLCLSIFALFTSLRVLVSLVGLDSYFWGIAALTCALLGYLSRLLADRYGEFFSKVIWRLSSAIYALAVAVVTTYSLAEIELNNLELTECIVDIILLKLAGAGLLTLATGEMQRRVYRTTLVLLATLNYVLIGFRLGFDFWRQHEYYAVPIGLAYLVMGIVERNKVSLGAKLKVLVGSFLSVMPMLLHTLAFRFVDGVPSSLHEIGVVFISLVLILCGAKFQLRVSVICGVSALAVNLFCVMFGVVGGGQKLLAAVLIAFGVGIFISTWLIYRSVKMRKIDTDQVMAEDLGRWK